MRELFYNCYLHQLNGFFSSFTVRSPLLIRGKDIPFGIEDYELKKRRRCKKKKGTSQTQTNNLQPSTKKSSLENFISLLE